MKKKVWLAAVSAVLVLALAITGTIAYLTDRDSDVNVFTWGNVDITLNEDFEQGATLIPGVDITKDVTVSNVGKSDAWVWVKIAMPAVLDHDDASKNVIHFNYAKDSVADGYWNWTKNDGAWNVAKNVVIEGKEYNVYTVLYETALKPGEETKYSAMTKVYLDTAVDIDPDGNLHKVANGVVTDIDWNIHTDGVPMIYVSAYATQAQGFDTVGEAYAAYNTQWGKNGEEWATPTLTVNNADQLNDYVAISGNLTFGADIETDTTVAEGADVSMDLDNKTLSGTVTNNGELAISNGAIEKSGDHALYNEGNATLTDVDLNMTDNPGYISNSRTADSVTVFENVKATSTGGGINVWEGDAVFKSGSITTNSISTSARHVFYVAAGATLTIEDGTFVFNPTNLTRKGSYICAQENATVIVMGGTFDKPSTRTAPIQALDGSTVTIYGGRFRFDPSAFVADGYEAVKGTDGWWTVSAK